MILDKIVRKKLFTNRSLKRLRSVDKAVEQRLDVTSVLFAMSYTNTELFPNIAERDIQVPIKVVPGPPMLLLHTTDQRAHLNSYGNVSIMQRVFRLAGAAYER